MGLEERVLNKLVDKKITKMVELKNNYEKIEAKVRHLHKMYLKILAENSEIYLMEILNIIS